MKKLIVLLSILPTLACAQTFDRDLYFGIQNDSDVTKLQDFLTDQEVYSGPITGNFFSLTLSAVKKFQSAQSISPVSGYFGPLSRGKANHILAAEGISSTGVTDESGSIMPVTTPAPKTTNDVVSSLMAQILLLQQQLNALQQQQQSLQTIQQQQTVQTQTLQTIQQNTTPTPTPSATPTPTPTPLSPSTVLPTPTPTAVPTPTPTPTPWVEIPATLALLPSSSTFIQPPLTNPVVASLSCLYAGNTDWGHYVNPSSFVYEVISNDFTKSDLPLSIRYGNNPSCADIYLTTYPQKGGKFQLEITALKFGSNGVESDAIGLPITTVQYEIRDPNNIVLWDNNVLGQGAIYQSPSSQIVNPYNQQIYSAIVYVGGHSTATLQANWTGSNPYNNLAYSYVPCDLSNLPGSCSQEPDPTRTTSANGGSFPISFTSGYNYAKINILIPSTAINGTGGYVTPSDSILNATLILQ